METLIKIAKTLVEWLWFDDGRLLKTFLYLLAGASTEDYQWNGHTITKGQLVTSYKELEKRLGMSTKQVRKAIDEIEEKGFIKKSKISKNLLIAISDINRKNDVIPTEGHDKGHDEGTIKGTMNSYVIPYNSGNYPINKPTEGHDKGHDEGTIKGTMRQNVPKNVHLVENSESEEPSIFDDTLFTLDIAYSDMLYNNNKKKKKDTKEKKEPFFDTSDDVSTHRHDDVISTKVNFSEAARRVYDAYPSKELPTSRYPKGRRVQKSTADIDKIARLLKNGNYSEEQLISIIRRYTEEQEQVFIMNLKTFLNHIPDYSDDEQPTEPKQKIIPKNDYQC